MKTLRNLVILILVLLCCGAAYAAVPHLINYQGRLTDNQGKPLEGLHSITFRIYDTESGGAPLWEETQSVNLEKGIFNVLLGSVKTLSPAFDKPYYLEIKVGDDVMSPRQKITSVGYAIMAENTLSIPRGAIIMWSGTLSSIPTDWQLCDGTNGTPDLRDKFIVGARVDDSGIAKTNITGSLTKSGGNISHAHTFSATAQANSDHWAVRNDYQNVGVAKNDHTHRVSGTTNSAVNLPPYYALCFIMKL